MFPAASDGWEVVEGFGLAPEGCRCACLPLLPRRMHALRPAAIPARRQDSHQPHRPFVTLPARSFHDDVFFAGMLFLNGYRPRVIQPHVHAWPPLYHRPYDRLSIQAREGTGTREGPGGGDARVAALARRRQRFMPARRRPSPRLARRRTCPTHGPKSGSAWATLGGSWMSTSALPVAGCGGLASWHQRGESHVPASPRPHDPPSPLPPLSPLQAGCHQATAGGTCGGEAGGQRRAAGGAASRAAGGASQPLRGCVLLALRALNVHHSPHCKGAET